MGKYTPAGPRMAERDSGHGKSKVSELKRWLHRTSAVCVAICATSVWTFSPNAAFAGRHAGGTLILHAEPSIVFTDGESYCGSGNLTACSEAHTSVPADPNQTMIFSCFAAFPAEADPLLVGVTFGIQYAGDGFTLVGSGGCGDLETPGENWPSSDSGTAIAWATAQTEHLVEVYWFAGYATASDRPTEVLLRTHPLQGGAFTEDGPAGDVDEIADYGKLGFGMGGFLPCPDGPVPADERSWGSLKAVFR